MLKVIVNNQNKSQAKDPRHGIIKKFSNFIN